jgi:hypothetical protein
VRQRHLPPLFVPLLRPALLARQSPAQLLQLRFRLL